MTYPILTDVLAQPYVSLAEFKAAPTWIDTDDLIPEGTQAQQDAELTNVLIRASAWADGYVSQKLGAHVQFEQTRARMGRYGRIMLHPDNTPVRQVVGFAYGYDPSNMTVLSDLSGVWVENSKGIVVSVIPGRGTFTNLEFGGGGYPGGEIFVQYQYVSGYACTTLSASAAAGASSLSVVDGTGFVAPSTALTGSLTGSTARIWEPGVEEAVTVGSNYTTGSDTLQLASPTVNPHTAGAAISEMPAEVRMGIITYAVALILRDEMGADGGSFGPSLRKNVTDGSPPGLIADAQNWLDRYRRTR